MDNGINFQKIIENNYSGITLLNNEFNIIYRSASTERITGWTNAKRLLSPFLTLVHPDDQAAVAVILEKTLAVAGRSLTCTFRTTHFNGDLIWLENTYTNMLDEGDVKAIVCNFRDVSEQKKTVSELKKQTEQISELLETMTDGFISLDNNLCYTYVNSQIIQMLGCPVQSMIGQHIWTLFPDAVGSATYEAIQTAYAEKKYVCNEDYYAPLQLWQENHVYPSAGGVSMFIRDISKQKKEQHHLKLLESVITNTTDAILITEAEPFEEPGPRILYVNEAFTKMTGYAAEEIIGQSPRILQGPKTDIQQLKRLGRSLRKWKPCEITVLNYKKNGEEFWINFTVNPVADEKGWYTHWISIDRDVTQRKNEEIQKALLAELSLIFKEPVALRLQLDRFLEKLINYAGFMLAEIWLTGPDKNTIILAAKNTNSDKGQLFYHLSAHVKSFAKGEGLPGTIWTTQKIQSWDCLQSDNNFLRREAATSAGLQKAYGVPLVADNITVGVLVLGLDGSQKADPNLLSLLEVFSAYFGAEIKRKQLDLELNQIFNSAPDIICSIGIDRHFKKVNPAMCQLMEYTEQELMSKSLISLVDPEDLYKCVTLFERLDEQNPTISFDNRFITKSGKVKWISWTTTRAADENLLFSVGKDITEKRELENLLNKVTDLARIGGWEIDLNKQTLYWSKITKEIHEVPDDFEPDLKSGIAFYEHMDDRDYISGQITSAIEKGTSFDFELPIFTAKANKKWVRVIGEPEFISGKCVRIYGSFQDVDARVKAERIAIEALVEKNTILESIGDAFFAVDKHWTVNYWNNMAENLLGKSKKEMINQNLWVVFSDAVDSVFYRKYHEVLETNMPVHFEDYYLTLDQWYEISAYPSVNGLSVYIKDITERKHTQNLLEESEKNYSSLFDLSPLPQWVYDKDSLFFLDVNKAAIDHYGYTREEFMCMTINNILSNEEMPLIKFLTGTQTRQQIVKQGTVTHKKKNGETILIEIQINDIEYKNTHAHVVIANDITERVSYIKAIEKKNARLEEISWMQSHLVRAPLSRIMGLILLLDEVNSDPIELKQITEYITNSAIQLDDIIRKISEKPHTID